MNIDLLPHYDLATVLREQTAYRKYLRDALADGRDRMRAQAEAYAIHLDRLEMNRHAKLEKLKQPGGVASPVRVKPDSGSTPEAAAISAAAAPGEADIDAMTAEVAASRPDLVVTSLMFLKSNTVGIAVGIKGRRRFAERVPAEGFDMAAFLSCVDRLVERSAKAPV